MDLDLSCVESFLVLAEERHFGRAAHRTNLSSSALTKRIQRLERQVGAKLVERSPDGVFGLTSAGARFAPRAAALLTSASAAIAAAGPPQQVRLGVPGRIGEYPPRSELRAIAQQLREKTPGTVLSCYGLPFSELTAALLDRRIDVLWTASEADQPELRSTPLGTFTRVGAVSALHSVIESTQLEVGQFAELPMVFNPALPQRWMSQFYLGDVRPQRVARLVEIEAQNTGSVMDSVARGLGTTVVPAPIARRMGPRFRAVELVGAPPAVFFGSTRRDDRRDAVLALTEAMAQAASRQ